MSTSRTTASGLITVTTDENDRRACEYPGCGIPARLLPLARNVDTGERGVFIHAEPRSLLNNLHNGTPDHNAVVTR